MVIDGINQHVQLSRHDIQALSHRHTGIGFDQCLVIEPANSPDVDFFYRIYNAQGEPVGQCGNGARCIARFIAHYQLSTANPIRVATATTCLSLQLNPDESVTVDMGVPHLFPAHIPLLAPTQADYYTIPSTTGESYRIHALSIGNPHAILMVDDVVKAPVAEVGQLICEHPLFPQQTNVGFCHILTPQHVQLRVYERGCGETQACGSGAVAAVVAGRLFHQLAPEVRVSLPGGDLVVHWSDLNGPIFLTGPASFVYEGQYNTSLLTTKKND